MNQLNENIEKNVSEKINKSYEQKISNLNKKFFLPSSDFVDLVYRDILD